MSVLRNLEHHCRASWLQEYASEARRGGATQLTVKALVVAVTGMETVTGVAVSRVFCVVKGKQYVTNIYSFQF